MRILRLTIVLLFNCFILMSLCGCIKRSIAYVDVISEFDFIKDVPNLQHKAGHDDLTFFIEKAGGKVDYLNNGYRIYKNDITINILLKFRDKYVASLCIIQNNIANKNTTNDAKGNNNPYRRKQTIFNDSNGYFLTEDQSRFNLRYDPSDSNANKDGYVLMPNVDINIEYSDAIECIETLKMIETVLKRLCPSAILRNTSNFYLIELNRIFERVEKK